MAKKHSWLLILPVIVVSASVAHADPIDSLVDKDLYTSQLSSPKDLEQEELKKEGVEQAPSPLTADEKRQLKAFADILWNRTWYANHPGALDHPGSVETQKEKDRLAKVLLPLAIKNYNKVIADIQVEKKQAGQKTELEASSTNDPGCRLATGTPSAEGLKSLVAAANAATQEAVRSEQSADKAKAQAEPVASLPADLKSEPLPEARVPVAPITKVDLATVTHADVSNSRFGLSGVTPTANQGVMLIVHKVGGLTTPTGSEVRGPILSDGQGHFDIQGYLAEGPGEYDVQVGYKDPSLANSYPTFKTFTVSNSDQQSEIYKEPSGLIKSDDPSTIALAQKIIADAGAKTDLQRAQAIHDWVATHVSYDYSEESVIAAGQPTPWKTSSDTISSGKGVCYDYAAAYAALGRAAGLQVRMASGLVQGSPLTHEWDEVLAGGNWISVDATWDAGQTASEKYFDPTSGFFDQTHQKQDTSNL